MILLLTCHIFIHHPYKSRKKLFKLFFINKSVNTKHKFNSNITVIKCCKIKYLASKDDLDVTVLKISYSYDERINEFSILSKLSSVYPEIIPDNINIDFNGIHMKKCEYDLNDIYLYLEEDHLTSIFFSILKCLEKLNCLGYIHSDIKPSNIVIDLHGNVKLIDFGLSKFIGIHPSNEMVMDSTTTIYFQPPEKTLHLDYYSYLSEMYNFLGKNILNSREIRFNYDIFSLGNCMAMMIEEKIKPHFSHNGQIYRIENNQVLPINLNVSEILKQYVIECLEFDYTLRKNARQFLEPQREIPIFDDYPSIFMQKEINCLYWNRINFTDTLYFSDIFDNYANQMIECKNSFSFLFEWLIEITLKNCKNYDILINSIMLTSTYSKFNTNSVSKLLGICCYQILCIHYGEVSMSIPEMIETCENAYNKKEIYDMIKKIIYFLPKYTMISVKSVVSYFTQNHEIKQLLFRGIIAFAMYDGNEKEKLIKIIHNILLLHQKNSSANENYRDTILMQRLKTSSESIKSKKDLTKLIQFN